MFNDEPLFSVSGAVALKILFPPGLIAPVLVMSTPPDATNGVIHSAPAVRAVAVLYWSVPLVP